MSKRKEEKLGAFVRVDLVAWAIFVGLALNSPSISAPVNWYLAIGISVLYAIFLLRLHLHKTKFKGKRVEKARLLSRFLLLNKIQFVTGLVMVVYSAYVLYQVGYLSGGYDTFSRIMYLQNVTRYELPEIPTTVFRGIIMSSLGIVGGVFAIASSLYYQGNIRGFRTKRQST